MLPNFLIIGAARSGTTTLYSHLQRHPDVYLPASKRPEPHFFLKSAEYARGLSYYEDRYFSSTGARAAVGEASTSYLFGSEVPKRIRNCVPNVKLVTMLRNPIERAFSSYWHTVKSGLEPLSFGEAIAQEPAREAKLAGSEMGEIAPYAYLARGFYHLQLVRWLAEFERDQLMIGIFDDLVSAPRQVLNDVATFIGVEPAKLPDREVTVENKSVPEEARMSRSMWHDLADALRDDVQELSALLERDLSYWLRAESARGIIG